MREPTVHDVVVYRHGTSVRVTPGTLVARTTDSIVFWLIGIVEATVTFPGGVAEGGARRVPLKGRSKAGDRRPLEAGRLALDEIGHGCWEYGVYVSPDNLFAEGGSQPKIIILE